MVSMFFKLLSIFLIIPIIELYLLIKVGGMIGALNTVLIILITASLGAYLAKSQGFRVLREIQMQRAGDICPEMNSCTGSLC
jgi:UPF0716 protein FxsA